MREVFHQSLEDVQGRLVEIAELVTVAIDKATRAFSSSDVALAEEVIRTLVGAIALVLAVPVTTAVGAFFAKAAATPAGAAAERPVAALRSRFAG